VWAGGSVRVTLFMVGLCACVARGEVMWSVTNPTTAPCAVRVTDMFGPAEDGYPYRGAYVAIIPAKTTVQFYTPRFSQAVYRFNYEPDVAGWAGYEPATLIGERPDGSLMVGYESNIYTTLPGASSGGGSAPELDWELFTYGFWWSFTFGMAFLLFWVVRRMNFGGINHNQP